MTISHKQAPSFKWSRNLGLDSSLAALLGSEAAEKSEAELQPKEAEIESLEIQLDFAKPTPFWPYQT